MRHNPGVLNETIFQTLLLCSQVLQLFPQRYTKGWFTHLRLTWIAGSCGTICWKAMETPNLRLFSILTARLLGARFRVSGVGVGVTARVAVWDLSPLIKRKPFPAKFGGEMFPMNLAFLNRSTP